jgi:hypothetical protein
MKLTDYDLGFFLNFYFNFNFPFWREHEVTVIVSDVEGIGSDYGTRLVSLELGWG